MDADPALDPDPSMMQMRPDSDPDPNLCYLCVQEQAEEEQFGPLLVGELVKHGVNATDVKKLQVDFSQTKDFSTARVA